MALSLGDVKQQPKPVKRSKPKAKKASSQKPKKSDPATEKVRPWQANPLDPAESPQKESPEAKTSSQAVTDSISRAAEEAEALFTTAQEQHRAARRQEMQQELINQWLEVAEKAKNQGIEALPTQVKGIIKDSWVGKIQLYPKVKIPVPTILHTKNDD